jgi:CDGSH-type Zn-finger protein
MEGPKITVTADGPYRVTGGVPISKQVIETDAEGASREWRHDGDLQAPQEYLLCRCGQSGNKPFCDDTHLVRPFNGTETADRRPYLEQAMATEGPEVTLTDARRLCAGARFCDPDGSAWNLVGETGDPGKQRMVEHQAGHCPSGRLVAWFRQTGQPFEPDLEPSIGLVQDPIEGVSGPLWVRGGIPIESADGSQYEARNRVTLCRCGASRNKPFCDKSHFGVQFRDGL